jgi:hypothetical protein
MQATSPEGVKRTQIQLASLQLGPTPSGYPTYGRSKLIEMVRYLCLRVQAIMVQSYESQICAAVLIMP